jgi:hypothetical protein
MTLTAMLRAMGVWRSPRTFVLTALPSTSSEFLGRVYEILTSFFYRIVNGQVAFEPSLGGHVIIANQAA